MKCPYCTFENSRVIDSRESTEGDLIRRRRECEKCEKRFTTYERVEESLPLVVKKDGRREAYDRAKLVGGIQKSCEKCAVSIETIGQIVDRVELQLQEMGVKEISSSEIGEKVMEELKKVDQIAYVRFASVYREFKDIHEFMSELSGLLKQPKKP